MIQTSVIISFQIEGIHNWPDARNIYPEVGFLSDPHRHMFHFKLCKKVNHDERDVEFIMWKRQVIDVLNLRYFNPTKKCHDFESMSCETIAKEILREFKCIWVEVFEDGENGARVERLPVDLIKMKAR